MGRLTWLGKRMHGLTHAEPLAVMPNSSLHTIVSIVRQFLTLGAAVRVPGARTQAQVITKP